jgi:hypothetical protein
MNPIKKSRIYSLFIGLMLMMLINSCDEPNIVEPPVTPPANGKVSVEYKLHHSGIDYTIGDTITHPVFNKRYIISNLKFYANYMQLLTSSGSASSINNYFLYDGLNPQPIIATLPIGNYTTLKYDLGIDSVTNHADPNQYAIDHPLGISSGMNWGQSLGYLFLMVEGYSETSPGATVNSIFKYDCGLDQLYKNVSIPLTNFQIFDNTTTTLTVEIDVDKIFDSTGGTIDIVANPITHSVGTLGIATANTILDNFNSACSY